VPDLAQPEWADWAAISPLNDQDASAAALPAKLLPTALRRRDVIDVVRPLRAVQMNETPPEQKAPADRWRCGA